MAETLVERFKRALDRLDRDHQLCRGLQRQEAAEFPEG